MNELITNWRETIITAIALFVLFLFMWCMWWSLFKVRRAKGEQKESKKKDRLKQTFDGWIKPDYTGKYGYEIIDGNKYITHYSKIVIVLLRLIKFIQKTLWFCGIAVHDPVFGECTPDGNCCCKRTGRKSFITIRQKWWLRKMENNITKSKKGINFACLENDNEIIYDKEDGDTGEFLFGHPSGVGGWTVIGANDLLAFLRHLGLMDNK